MMPFEYRSGNGDTIRFGGDSPYFADPDIFLDYELSYTLDKAVVDIARGSSEVSLPITIFADNMDGSALIERMTAAFEHDTAALVPGTISVNGYDARAYAVSVKFKTDEMIDLDLIEIEAGLLFESHEWVREHTYQYLKSGTADKSGMDYPHDYPHDYGSSFVLQNLKSPCNDRADARITIYGPAVNPYVIIGGNRYEVAASVPENGLLIIDGASRPNRMITLCLADGSKTNVFSLRRGVQRTGSGSFIFEPVPPGTSLIEWSGVFGFDVTLVERRSNWRCC